MRRLSVVLITALLLASAPTFGADLGTQKPTLAGTVITYTAAAVGGDTFTNTGQEAVHVRTAGTPVTITVTARTACEQGVFHNQVVTVAANTERVLGPFRDKKRWNDQQQKVSLTYNQVTGVTIAVVGR